MENFKKYFVLVVFFFVGFFVKAQQQGQYSQYMMNYFLINPGVAGTEDLIGVRAGYRMQWAGLSGSPRNYYVSGHIPLNKVHSRMTKARKKPDAYHVAGAMFTGQTLGAFSHNTGYLSYAYHLPLSTNWIMSMGAVGGLNQFTVDQNKLDFGDQLGDAAAGNVNKIKPDLGLGIWLYSDKIFMGISSMQILQTKASFSDAELGQGMLNRHFYFTGGYKIELNEDLKVIPSVLVKNTTTALQFDINTKVRFRDFLWAGVSYRKQDAIVGLVGVGVPLGESKMGDRRLEIGYSYDYNTSKLRTFNGGSHEVMVALILPMAGRVLCPSNYW